jgi:hypothetical protein
VLADGLATPLTASCTHLLRTGTLLERFQTFR